MACQTDGTAKNGHGVDGTYTDRRGGRAQELEDYHNSGTAMEKLMNEGDWYFGFNIRSSLRALRGLIPREISGGSL
jgi:hypothetical protein